jgi:Ca2+-binding EF-hand superfamily protein
MLEIKKEITDSINFDEFIGIMMKRIGERESKANLEKIFKMFDIDEKGAIGISDLIRISKEIGNIMFFLVFI